MNIGIHGNKTTITTLTIVEYKKIFNMFPEFFIVTHIIQASKKFWLSTVVRKHFLPIGTMKSKS